MNILFLLQSTAVRLNAQKCLIICLHAYTALSYFENILVQSYNAKTTSGSADMSGALVPILKGLSPNERLVAIIIL